MSIELEKEQLVIKQPTIGKKKIGLKRYITQITDTIYFELKRTWKTFLVMLANRGSRLCEKTKTRVKTSMLSN